VTEGSIEEKIVERAEMKLHLDQLVIQQGRLVDTNRANSKEQMLGMIKFGAEKILNEKEGTITDEDIDKILERGAKITEEMNKKFTNTATSVYNFSLHDNSGKSLYEFEGIDYSQKKLSKQFIEPPKRERKLKTNYNEAQYYRKCS